MSRLLACTFVGLCVSVALPGKDAAAHHPTTAPRQAAPRAIGALSQVSLAFEVTQFQPPQSIDQITAMRLRAGAAIWFVPWLGVSLSIPLQSLDAGDGRNLGLGNASVAATLRGIYSNGFELLLSSELHLPTFSDQVGANENPAIAPQVVLARRDVVTTYLGAAAVLELGETGPDPMPIPSPMPVEVRDGNELLVFGGATTSRGILDFQAEARFARGLSSESSNYVGVVLGSGVTLAEKSNINASLEIPILSGDRLDWSATLRFTQSL